MSVVEPDTPLPDSMRGHERLAVRSNRDALLFRGSESELLWCALRKTLAPKMKSVSGVSAHILAASIVQDDDAVAVASKIPLARLGSIEVRSIIDLARIGQS